ncbi:unnamed protein product [Gongylonema pulchrum]|uniref:Pkinase_fungal domain-containing protein n=1 Tax=Gongylonema pulchrum TaxID=637853 RepID=A0A183ECV3_9BILA|nr:unnamed protein product [Gongylonema pulchrum]
MVFELRGKPFTLRDTGRLEGVYSLCRNWIRDSDDGRPKEKREIEHPEPPDDALVWDLLATKEIWALPRPHDNLCIDPAPKALYMDKKLLANMNTSSKKDMMNAYLSHWKMIKKKLANLRVFRQFCCSSCLVH